jgi:hypothetical protein
MLEEGGKRAVVWWGEEGGVEKREGWRAQLGREAAARHGWGGRKGPRVLGVGRGLYMATGRWAASGPEMGRGGPNFLCREPTNLALVNETILIKLILK